VDTSLLLNLLAGLSVLGLAAGVFVVGRHGNPLPRRLYGETLRAGSTPEDTPGEAGRRAVSRAVYESGGFYGGAG